MRGRWQLTTTAGSMQASPSLTLVVWFAIAIVGGGRRIKLARRGRVETSSLELVLECLQRTQAKLQNVGPTTLERRAPGTILSSKEPLRGCNTKKGRAGGSETSRWNASHICAFRKVAILSASPLHPFHLVRVQRDIFILSFQTWSWVARQLQSRFFLPP